MDFNNPFNATDANAHTSSSSTLHPLARTQTFIYLQISHYICTNKMRLIVGHISFSTLFEWWQIFVIPTNHGLIESTENLAQVFDDWNSECIWRSKKFQMNKRIDHTHTYIALHTCVFPSMPLTRSPNTPAYTSLEVPLVTFGVNANISLRLRFVIIFASYCCSFSSVGFLRFRSWIRMFYYTHTQSYANKI